MKQLRLVSGYDILYEKVKDFVKRLKTDKDLLVGDCLMSNQRLKSTFNNYFFQHATRLAYCL